MFRIPPSVYGTKNLKNTEVASKRFYSENAIIGRPSGSTGFFGSSSQQQTLGIPSVERMNEVLVNYGLLKNEWAQEGPKLIGTDGLGNSQQGTSVSLSADGNTMAEGGPNFLGDGATWIFTRTNGTWTQQGSILIGDGIIGFSQQGESVSLSSDGNTLAVGGPTDDNYIGATWIFTRSSGVWTQQAKLVGSGVDGPSSNQGKSVSLSSDGNTLAVGGYADDSEIGAVWIFTRSLGIWTQQGSKLVGSGGITLTQNQGWSVSLSPDGNTLASGGPFDDSFIGATWIFVRNNGVWSQQGAKLIGSGYDTIWGGTTWQGYSVNLQTNKLAIGGPMDNNSDGAVWIFTRSNGIWTQQGSKIFQNSEPSGRFGSSVSIKENTLFIGAPLYFSEFGTIYVYKEIDGYWYQSAKLLGNSSQYSLQGTSVSTSSDGKTIVSGGRQDDSNAGATWIFVNTEITEINQPQTNVSPIYSTEILSSFQTHNLFEDSAIFGSLKGKIGFFGAPVQQQSLIPYSEIELLKILEKYKIINTPWIQQGSKLIGDGYIPPTLQGISVSLSGDSNTLAVGGYDDDSAVGAVWIFIKSLEIWTQQGLKLVGTGGIGSQYQGYSVSLSSDGNTLAVGGPEDDFNTGAVWIFVRSGSMWTQQGTKLVGTGGIGTQYQGFSVLLSSDGNTLAVGGILDDSLIGATWVFTRSSGVWTQQGTKLVGTGGTGAQQQGHCVSLNSSGNVLVVGGILDDSLIGATWVFMRSAGIWSQQGSKLVGTGGQQIQLQGSTVAISRNGNTIVVGGKTDNDGSGAVWTFKIINGVWIQQGQKLFPNDLIGQSEFGTSVCLSEDGNILGVSAGRYNNLVGITYVFKNVNDQWSQIINLIGSEYIFEPRQGFGPQSVSISNDGKTLAVGGQTDNINVGAAWVFIDNETN